MIVEINNESDTDFVDEADLVNIARYAMEQMHVHPEAELSLLLVDEDAMSVLHEEWLGEPGPTDVMSFPMDELRPGRPDQPSLPGMLGDIVMCATVARAQAETAGHSTQAELQLLTVHGVLHLLGYDHATDEERAEMFGIQDGILARYQAR